MIYAVALIGVSLSLLCVAGLAAPAAIVDRVRALSRRGNAQKAAIMIRFIVGCILMLAAPDSAYPMILLTIGALVFLAGLALVFVDEARFAALIEWALRLPDPVVRGAFAVCLLLGVFLVYAVSV